MASPSIPRSLPSSRRLALLLGSALLMLLSGCDKLGIPTPASTAARKEADAKAVGAACRHAGRAIEDCYLLNRKAEKSFVYAGWREMDDYMRENKIEPVAPVVPRAPLHAAKPASEAGDDETDPPAQAHTAEAGGNRIAKR